MSTCGKYSQHPEQDPDPHRPVITGNSGPVNFIPMGKTHGYTCSEPQVTQTCAQPYTNYCTILTNYSVTLSQN